MFNSKVDREIFKDFLKSLSVWIIIVFSLFIAIYGGIQVGNDITYQLKYRDYVNDRISSGYEVYLNGTLVHSDKISIYTYPNKSIKYDDELKRVYIGFCGE